MAKAKPESRNVAMFKGQYHRSVVIPTKIAAALEKMAKDHSPEHYEYEADFVKMAGISITDMNGHREAFSKYIVEAKPIGSGNGRTAKRVWFATEKAAKAARGE